MDIRLSLTVILGGFSLVFLIIARIIYRRDRKIKNESTEKTKGKVIKYSWQQTRAPVVEYWVDQESYQKALYYSYMTEFSSPISSVKVSVRDDLLDTKLRLRKNTVASLNTLMYDHFSLDSEMTVYYHPDNPKLAYVERYAENYTWLIFFVLALLFMLTLAIVWLIS